MELSEKILLVIIINYDKVNKLELRVFKDVSWAKFISRGYRWTKPARFTDPRKTNAPFLFGYKDIGKPTYF